MLGKTKSAEELIQELIELQQSKVLKVAREIIPDATPEDVLEAMFIVVIRMEAELADERASIDQSQKRLEQYLISTCGDSATFLFGLLSGMGQKI